MASAKELRHINILLHQFKNLCFNHDWKFHSVDEKVGAIRSLQNIIDEGQKLLHVAFLNEQSTPTLLNWLALSRATGFAMGENPGEGYSYNDIKAVLAGRPHIKNKKESREARKKKAKKGY